MPAVSRLVSANVANADQPASAPRANAAPVKAATATSAELPTANADASARPPAHAKLDF